MNFQITPNAKQLILNQGGQITVCLEREECCSCAGQVTVPYLSARVGRPNDIEMNKYEIVSEDDISIYVHNDLYNLGILSSTFAIDISKSNETLIINGVVSER